MAGTLGGWLAAACLAAAVQELRRSRHVTRIVLGSTAETAPALADAALSLFKDDVPGRHAVATTIPISGTVQDPHAQPIPTVIGVLRNAFVRGLADSLSGLPPPKATKQQGVLEQARTGLSPNKQPRAQPGGKK